MWTGKGVEGGDDKKGVEEKPTIQNSLLLCGRRLVLRCSAAFCCGNFSVAVIAVQLLISFHHLTHIL